MESNSRLHAQIASDAGVSADVAQLAAYMADLSRSGKTLDHAAMMLAKPDWWLRLGGPLSEDAYGWSRMEDRVFRAGFDMIGAPYSAGAIGKTLPLALTAACLKARASLAREPGEVTPPAQVAGEGVA